jgi:hypothetical protein
MLGVPRTTLQYRLKKLGLGSKDRANQMVLTADNR